MKPTPGPWVAASAGPVMREGYKQPFAIGEKGKPNLIAGVFGDVKGGPEVAEANAKMIAATPEAIDLLEQIMERCLREDPDNSMLRFYTDKPELDFEIINKMSKLLTRLGRHP